jgi:O-acetylserine/cysteine efflux transporter
MQNNSLSPKHLVLALMVVVVWGLNFIAVFYGLKGFPPFLLCAFRFGLAAIPWVFFLPKPEAPIKFVIAYGLFNFALQFGLLFSGIHLGLSPGLASLVLQVQVFFSIGLAFLFFRDRPSPLKIVGSLISFIGIAIVALKVGGGATFIGLILTLLAALSWATGTIFTKKVDSKSSLALVVWGNLVAFPFMMILSLWLEGPALIWSAFQNISWITVGAIIYIVYVSTHIGYSTWGFLLNTYSTSVVVPFTLLIPVVGFISSAFLLGEDLAAWKFLASFFIMAGLIFSLLESETLKLIRRLRSRG